MKLWVTRLKKVQIDRKQRRPFKIRLFKRRPFNREPLQLVQAPLKSSQIVTLERVYTLL